MNRILLGLCAVVLVTTGCNRKPVRSAGEIWKERISQVQPGMTRGEIEALLPPNTSAPQTRNVQGDSQAIVYWLDDQWKVTLEYDFTGIPKEQAGKGAYDSPENKLLKAPVLERQYL